MKGSSRGVLVAIERPKGPVGVNGAGIAEEPPPPVAPAEPREKAVKDGCKNSEGQYLTSLVCRSGPSDSRCQHRIHRSAPVPAARSTGIPTPRSGRPRRCQQQHCSHQPRICRPCDHTWGQSQGRGTGLAAKAVATQGRGTGLAAKAVTTQGKGTGLAAKAVTTQGKGGALRGRAIGAAEQCCRQRRDLLIPERCCHIYCTSARSIWKVR